LSKFSLKPKKSLGQHFLSSQKIVEDIIRAAGLKSDDVVLEVGPGKGILTEAILEKIPQGKLIAVEKDKRLIKYLIEKFHDRKNFQLTHGDILKFNITRYALRVTGYKIIANIPYYLTSRLLRQFLQSDFQPSLMVLMLQKEVAERIVATNKKESILSTIFKAYGQPKIIKKVPAGYFSPKPKVDSAILLIDNISKDFFAHIDEQSFFTLVKQGFSSKRKLLKNNLKLSNAECLTKCGIAEKARAEDLSPENWKCLYKSLV
jgi:16S rRNA (adenine1518-N6/adenine1519-N6)-dimethyltransferase